MLIFIGLIAVNGISQWEASPEQLYRAPRVMYPTQMMFTEGYTQTLASEQQGQPTTGAKKMLTSIDKMSKLPSRKTVSIYIQSETYLVCIKTNN